MSEGDRLPLVFAVRLPTLAIRLAAGFVRFLGTRRSGVETFRVALVEGGMPRDLAERLTQSYREAGSVGGLLRNFASRGMREARD